MSEDVDWSEINIRHFKLSSGVDIIGMVIDPNDLEDDSMIDENMIILNRPMAVDVIEKSDRTMFLFNEWQPLSKHTHCFVNAFHVLSHTECSDDIKEQYIRVAVSSGADALDTEDELEDDGMPNIKIDSTGSGHYH